MKHGQGDRRNRCEKGALGQFSVGKPPAVSGAFLILSC